MNIDESKILEGGERGEQLALAYLLAADVCFIGDINAGTKENPDYAACIGVNCNDTFYYACADAEYIYGNEGEPDSEILALYKIHKEIGTWASVKWVALKRGIRPIAPIVDMMKRAEAWDDSLEALPAPPNPWA